MLSRRNIAYHNIAATTPCQENGSDGSQLWRISREVATTLSPRGQWMAQATLGGELRFVTDASHIEVQLSTRVGDAEVLVFQGERLVQAGWLQPGQVTCLKLKPPERRIVSLAEEPSRFAPQVWRVMLAGYHSVFHGLDSSSTSIRLPQPEEQPITRWLAYGSSITAGSGSARCDLCYAQIAAQQLGVDVLNMGFGGSCHAEPELADFFADQMDWDFATLELGINMRDIFEPSEFEKRVGYMIDRLLNVSPQRPVVLISPFIAWGSEIQKNREAAYVTWMRQRVADDNTEHLHFIDGHSILNEYHLLNADLVHPGAQAHTLMGHRLAEQLNKTINI